MLHYLFGHKGLAIGLMVSLFLSCLISVGFALSFQPVIDAATMQNGNLLGNAIMWFALFGLGDCFFLLLSRFLSEHLICKATIALRRDIFDGIMNMEIADFKVDNSGSYLSTLDNDVKIVAEQYFGSIFQIYKTVISFVLSLLAVLLLNQTIAIILLIIGFCSVLIPKLFDAYLSSRQSYFSSQMEEYLTKAKDFFEGFEILKSFHIQEKARQSHLDCAKNMEKAGCQSRTAVYFAGWISMLLSTAMFVITLSVGGYFVIIGTATIGMILALSQLIGGVVAPIEQFAPMMAELHAIKPITQKLIRLRNVPPSSNSQKLPEALCFEKISLNDVTFSYPSQQDPVLQNIQMELRKGEKYAIIGESGSGKSTLGKLLLRFYPCEEGTIDLNDRPLTQIPAETLYQTIRYIHQNNFLFDDSLWNNITLYRESTEEQVWDAIEAAGLTTFVQNLPQGLQTPLGENGSFCSGGEKQRIGIARALLQQAGLLILDEATSNLDNICSAEIMRNILDRDNLTVLLITHQLHPEILRRCKRIFVLRKGRLIEEGSFDQLSTNSSYFSYLLGAYDAL